MRDRQRLQEPDVRDRRGQLDMAHALAADLRDGDLDAALLADDALVLHALVLAAQALVILDRTEDARAEQAVTLGLERAVVDRLGLLDLAERPASGCARATRCRSGSGRRSPAWRPGWRIWSVRSCFCSLCRVKSLGRARGGRAVVGSAPLPYSAAIAAAVARRPRRSSIEFSSTLRPSERISLTSTLKLSGMPASNVSSPLTIAS